MAATTMDAQLSGCWNIERLNNDVLLNKDICIKWCKSVGLLPSMRKCPKNSKELMVLKPSSRAYRSSNTCLGFRWICKKHRLERTLAEHTWFERHNIPIEDVLRLTYYFSRGFKIEDAVNEISVPGRNCISHSTVMDIYSYCREVCMCRLDTLYEASGPIGGPGKLVEIDEMKFGRRKYEKCRVIEGA